jgi:hypothetical protein
MGQFFSFRQLRDSHCHKQTLLLALNSTIESTPRSPNILPRGQIWRHHILFPKSSDAMIALLVMERKTIPVTRALKNASATCSTQKTETKPAMPIHTPYFFIAPEKGRNVFRPYANALPTAEMGQ